MHIPTFQDVLFAQRQIAPYLRRTPLHRYPALDDLLSAAPLAAADQMRDQLAGKRIELICSGGNLSLEHLRKAVCE